MSVESLFATRIYSARLRGRGVDPLNDELLHECRRLRLDDAAGRRWSIANYPGGFTSYGSAHKMHAASPTFAELQRRLAPHVARFAAVLDLDLRGRPLEMTDCWVNIMPHGTHHGLHLHPASTLSGTYYVRTPGRCPGLKFEDPRIDRYMAAPPRRTSAVRANQLWVQMPVETGCIILFESWLRHEVAANPARTERISISFNYSWF